MDSDAVLPAWPIVRIELFEDGTVRVDGEEVAVAAGDSPRQAALTKAAETARLLRRPVRAEAVEPDGTIFPLIVAVDATVTEAGEPSPAPTARRGLFGRTKPVVASTRGTSTRGRNAPERAMPPIPRAAKASPERPIERAEPPAEDAAASVSEGEDSERPFGWETARALHDAQGAPPATPMAVEPRSADPAPVVVRPEEEPEAFPAHVGVADDVMERARKIAEIFRAVQASDLQQALALAVTWETEQEAGKAPEATGLAREVQAYVTLLAGQPDVAVGLYVSAITLRNPDPGDVDAIRVAENAHYCWLQVSSPEERPDLAALVLSGYAKVAPDGHPAEQAVRRRMGTSA